MTKEHLDLQKKVSALRNRLIERIKHLETKKHEQGESNLWLRDALEDVVTELDDLFSDTTVVRPMDVIIVSADRPE